MKIALFVALWLIILLTGCSGAKPATPAQTVSANESTSPNTTVSSNISTNETSLTPVPPWLNIDVFADTAVTINTSVGQEFIIRYDFYHNMFATFNADFQNPEIVILLDKKTSGIPGQEILMDGYSWFLFRAVETGATNITIKEIGHLSEGVVGTKTFTINVVPPGPLPFEVVSAASIGPVNPGGPVVEITLKNVSSQPIVSLTAALNLVGPKPYVFNFPAPVLPGTTSSTKLVLISGGYENNTSYPLTVNGTMQDGHKFTFNTIVKIQ